MRKMNIIVMILAGLLLVAASVMKVHEMLSICVPSWDANAAYFMQSAEKASETMPAWKANIMGFWESYEFLLMQIPLEFALGVWMVSGLFRKAAWIAGTLCYGFFIVITLVKALLGLESCGCFGQVHVDPWITLWAVDVPFFLLLAIFRPKGYKLLPPPWPNTFYLLAVFVITVGLMVLIPPTLVAFRPDCIKAEAQQPDESAKYKLQNYQLKQDLQKQTNTVDSLKEQLETNQQTIDTQKQQIQALQQQVQKLKQAVEQSKTIEPEITETIEQPSEPARSDEAEQAAPVEPETTEPQVEPRPDMTQQTEAQTPAVEQWDWLQYIVEDEVREQLSTGLVVILMYHHDCPTCTEMVPKYSAYDREMTEQGVSAFKIAFLAVPPYGETTFIPEETTCILGKLTDQQKWEVTSPYVVALLDGELVKTWPQGTAPEPENILDEVFGQ